MRFFQKVALILFLALIALFLQSSVLKLVLPSPAVPNLCLLLVLFLAFHDATVLGAFLCFTIGLLFAFLVESLNGEEFYLHLDNLREQIRYEMLVCF